MNKENNTVQKQFCIWCGNEIKPGSKFCPKCGKQQTDEENQLIDWLIAHTKDKLKGDAESSLFDAIKNFILSHLYGTLMSIAIVAAVGVTVYANEPYIEKYSDADAPVYSTDVLDNSYSQTNELGISEIRTICNDYLSVISNENNNPADGRYGFAPPAGFKFSGKYDVVYDEKFVSDDTFYLRDLTSKVITESKDFTLEISKQMHTGGYNVAEYIKEQYLEDAASAEKVYTRQLTFSVVEVNDHLYIAESRITSFTENENYQWPLIINETKLENILTDYITAIFTGNSTEAYEYPIDNNEITLYKESYTLPEKCYGFENLESVYIALYHRGSSLPAGEYMENAGYEVFTASVNVKVTEKQASGHISTMDTSHTFAFVVVDNNYYIIDDTIGAVGHIS